MELIYRGQHYNYDPAKAPERPIRQSPYKLNYRGVTYLVHRNALGDAISAEDDSNKGTIKHNLFNLCLWPNEVYDLAIEILHH